MILPRPRICLWLLACIALSACRRPAEKIFEVSTDGASRTGLVETQRGVLVGNEAGFLTLIDAEGKTLWRTRLEREISARPVVAGEHVVATTRGGEWVGLSLAEGAVRWRVAGQPVVSTPLSTDGTRVFVVQMDLTVRAIDPSSGATAWEWSPPKGLKNRALALPLVANGVLVLPMREGGMVGLDGATGELRWRYPLVPALSVATDGTAIFGVDVQGKVVALDGGGKRLWEQALDRPLPGPLSVAGDRVYVPAGAEVVALDVRDGKRLWSAEVPAPTIAVTVAGETVVVPVADPAGTVLLFRPPSVEKSGELRLDSPVRSAPVFFQDRLLLLGSDGRVLGMRLNRG